jgi:site-specific recombinase XerD
METKLKTITVMESHQLLNALLVREGTPKQFRRGVRNYAMALLMLDAGLRVGEVCKLLQSDLLFGSRVVQSLVVRAEIAKYNIERTVPLSSRCQMALAELRDKVWGNDVAPDLAFAFFGKKWTFRITERQVQRIIADAALRSIGRKIHPHVLRHTFGTRLMRTVNASVVQALLGHKQLSSTQVYCHPDAEDLKNAIDSIAEPVVT